jgi:hypothetical protein
MSDGKPAESRKRKFVQILPVKESEVKSQKEHSGDSAVNLACTIVIG